VRFVALKLTLTFNSGFANCLGGKLKTTVSRHSSIRLNPKIVSSTDVSVTETPEQTVDENRIYQAFSPS
jgi:hypothetical protein